MAAPNSMNRTHRLVRHSQVRRLLHLLGGLEEPVLLPLLEPSRRRHAGPPPPLQIKSGTRHRTGFKPPTPPAAAPKSSRPASTPRGHASKRDPAGGPPIRNCARQEKAGDCLRASAPAGRKRKRGEEGDVGGWATRRGVGGRGEERRGRGQ